MAFEQPLEADQVTAGDSILISFVTRPVLGTLMWIIGDGNDNDKDDNNKQQTDDALQRGLQDMILDDDTSSSSVNPHSNNLPRLLQSDVSVAPPLFPRKSSFSSLLNIGGDQEKSSQHHEQHPFKKKMSWSNDLVEYMDHESIIHEPAQSSPHDSPTITTKPAFKSAITRSNSHLRGVGGGLRSSQSVGSEDSERKLRYLPAGLDKAHNGLRMPTRPGMDHHSSNNGGGAAGAAGGIESPQWGWYINTTPPTPEMYHSRSSLHGNKHSSSHQHQGSASTSSNGSISMGSSSGTSSYDPSNPDASRGPNRVFQGLRAGSNRPPVGWPSVPL